MARCARSASPESLKSHGWGPPLNAGSPAPSSYGPVGRSLLLLCPLARGAGHKGRVCSKVVNFLFQPAVIFFPGPMGLGPFWVSVYGLFAAAGLIAALLLSQRTARLAGLVAQELWDASLFAIVAAFVISRLLLIVRDPQALLSVPMKVLALPSFTYGGMALTALAVAAYLKWKRLPVLAVLDAWAPCAALLAAALSLGHFFEGTDAGMPTRLPWSVHVPGLGRVQPVQIYGVAGSLVLFAVLMRMLQRRLRAGMAGVVAGVALVAGGGIAFLIDMLTQPAESGGAWLDPGQWIALGAMVVGTLMLTFLKETV
jgi:phosphatidylglycerol:prolipoprotein diacylglycerol transferase